VRGQPLCNAALQGCGGVGLITPTGIGKGLHRLPDRNRAMASYYNSKAPARHMHLCTFAACVHKLLLTLGSRLQSGYLVSSPTHKLRCFCLAVSCRPGESWMYYRLTVLWLSCNMVASTSRIYGDSEHTVALIVLLCLIRASQMPPLASTTCLRLIVFAACL
jgi:hypothetical protein